MKITESERPYQLPNHTDGKDGYGNLSGRKVQRTPSFLHHEVLNSHNNRRGQYPCKKRTYSPLSRLTSINPGKECESFTATNKIKDSDEAKDHLSTPPLHHQKPNQRTANSSHFDPGSLKTILTRLKIRAQYLLSSLANFIKRGIHKINISFHKKTRPPQSHPRTNTPDPGSATVPSSVSHIVLQTPPTIQVPPASSASSNAPTFADAPPTVETVSVVTEKLVNSPARLIDFNTGSLNSGQKKHDANVVQTNSFAGANKDPYLVEKYGGHMVFAFNQGEGAFKLAKYEDLNTRPGICGSISMNWIVGHSKGQSLLNHIYKNGNYNDINAENMKILVLPYIEGKGRNDKLLDFYRTPLSQELMQVIPPTSSRKFLENNSLILSQFPTLPLDPKGLSITVKPFEPSSLLAAMLYNPLQSEGVYKSIELTGSSCAHAVALHISESNELVFFDPNLGELSFSNSSDFKDWFTQEYWTRIHEKEDFIVFTIAPDPLASFRRIDIENTIPAKLSYDRRHL